MLEILSTLDKLIRVDVTATSWALNSGVTGTFVKINGANGATRPAAGEWALPIWNESSRTDAVGAFTPDTNATGKVTLLYGKLHAKTDQFSGTPAAGDKLSVDANGKLQVESGSGIVVAICVRASHTHTYLRKNYSVIEFFTI